MCLALLSPFSLQWSIVAPPTVGPKKGTVGQISIYLIVVLNCSA